MSPFRESAPVGKSVVHIVRQRRTCSLIAGNHNTMCDKGKARICEAWIHMVTVGTRTPDLGIKSPLLYQLS